jgi:hypothetical protein
MSKNLYEVTWYSPTDYDIHHYGLIEASSPQQAGDMLEGMGHPLRMAGQPMGIKLVGNVASHRWGKGFSERAGDLQRRLQTRHEKTR